MANEFIARKGFIALESSQITGSLNVSGGITGSLLGTSSWATNAITASSVTTLNQNVLITGSLTIGSSSIGSSENTLIVGPPPAGGAGEGGQILLQAVGGTYATASMIDNYQNQTRLLRGTNAGSDAVVASWNMHSKQMQLPSYNSTTAFTATTLVGILGFDANGNILTTNTSSGGGGGVTINNNTDNYLITATGTANTLNGEANLQFNGSSLSVTGNITASGTITAQANGAMYFRGGDDAELWDINVANTLGIYGQQNQGIASIKLGSGGGVISGRSGSIGIGITTPNSGALHVNGGVFATSFTGSLFGTSSWSTNALTASFVNNLNQNLSITGSVVLSGSGLPELRVIGDTQFTGSINSLNGYTGSLFGTASWATNAISSSLAVRNLITASVSLNTITFTKGDGTTFPIVVNTGSGGGGGSVTINNNTDNYVITATGTANTLNGEAALTFDGTTLSTTDISATGITGDVVIGTTSVTAGDLLASQILIQDDVTGVPGEYTIGSQIAYSWGDPGNNSLLTGRAGQVVYLSGSGDWKVARANTTGSSTSILGIVTSAEDQRNILLQGAVTLGTNLNSLIAGQPVYLSPLVDGEVTLTPPSSSGHIVRLLGWTIPGSGNDNIYFSPDNSYIVRT